ncbi:hypothetical protein APR11_004788 [Nocardia amikacinitolerans]|nr:hypothetical protein [Nocardia amikacinitolerans]
MAGEDTAKTAEWLTWCRGYAVRIDPTVQGMAAPPEVEPQPEDLRPYMPRRMNPYRP